MIDRMSRIAGADKRMRALVDPVGAILADGFHLMGLFAIGAATVWAAVATFWSVVEKGSPTIDDLLLLFIYLEIGSMVGIYFRTNHLPVRFLLYVGITALTRHTIGYVQDQQGADLEILILTLSTLILGSRSSLSASPRTASRAPSTARLGGAASRLISCGETGALSTLRGAASA